MDFLIRRTLHSVMATSNSCADAIPTTRNAAAQQQSTNVELVMKVNSRLDTQ